MTIMELFLLTTIFIIFILLKLEQIKYITILLYFFILICIFYIYKVDIYNTVKKYYQIRSLVKKIERENNSHLLFLLDESNETILKSNEYFKIFNKIIPIEITNRIINLDNDDKFIRWISEKFTSDKLIQIILNTRGGSISSSDAIFNILLRYKKKIKVYIPYYACSAGSMIALSADKIYMNRYSYMSPVDPQIYFDYEEYSSNIMIKLLQEKEKSSIDDKILLASEEAVIYHKDNLDNLNLILKKKKYSSDKIKIIVDEFGSGKYPHHKQFLYDILKKMGIKVSMRMPKDIDRLSKLILS